MDSTTLTTGAGVTITRTAADFDPARLAELAALVERRRGGVLSSGMEYPGRYTRWHLAYVNPPVEIATRGRQVTARALNDRGRVLMPVIAAALRRVGTEIPEPPQDNSKKREAQAPAQAPAPDQLTVHVAEGDAGFTAVRVRTPLRDGDEAGRHRVEPGRQAAKFRPRPQRDGLRWHHVVPLPCRLFERRVQVARQLVDHQVAARGHGRHQQ